MFRCPRTLVSVGFLAAAAFALSACSEVTGPSASPCLELSGYNGGNFSGYNGSNFSGYNGANFSGYNGSNFSGYNGSNFSQAQCAEETAGLETFQSQPELDLGS